ncbi:YciI family protein [Lentzea sp. NPDC059081]|uniref:YciI family protein n=1 Tax=Lentzea sp. NPDC059081 TaxID=3346719 RepID=UPI0036A5AC6D
MAKYMILIYGDTQQWAAMTEEQWQAHHTGHGAFMAKAGDRLRDGQQLDQATVTTSLRADADGQVSATEGSFLGAKETLGGYYIVETADLDEALELARLLPELNHTHSGLEVRKLAERG